MQCETGIIHIPFGMMKCVTVVLLVFPAEESCVNSGTPSASTGKPPDEDHSRLSLSRCFRHNSGIKSCVIVRITYVWTFLFVCEIAVLQWTVNELLKATHLIRERCYGIFIQEACFIFYIWLQKHVLTWEASPAQTSFPFRKDTETKRICVCFIYIFTCIIY